MSYLLLYWEFFTIKMIMEVWYLNIKLCPLLISQKIFRKWTFINKLTKKHLWKELQILIMFLTEAFKRITRSKHVRLLNVLYNIANCFQKRVSIHASANSTKRVPFLPPWIHALTLVFFDRAPWPVIHFFLFFYLSLTLEVCLFVHSELLFSL